MAKVVNFHPNMDDDMRDYHKKIRKHRTAVVLKYVIAVCLVLLAVFGIRYYLNNRSYTGYSIASTTERKDTITTKYASFGDNILKYSRDGVSYTDASNSLLFSITYTMQDPILALSEKSGAVADKNGNQIYIFNQEEPKGQITTLLPIKHLAISNQGVVAVLMEESSSSKLEIYSADGTLIGDGIFDLQDAGAPMNLSISSDGTKIAITFAQINGSKLNSCVAVYNFDSVGENYVDQLVFAKNYTEYLIPEVHYFDNSAIAAVGDGILAFYQGTQIPELVQEVTFTDKIKSVFYGDNAVGLVFEDAAILPKGQDDVAVREPAKHGLRDLLRFLFSEKYRQTWSILFGSSNQQTVVLLQSGFRSWNTYFIFSPKTGNDKSHIRPFGYFLDISIEYSRIAYLKRCYINLVSSF